MVKSKPPVKARSKPPVKARSKPSVKARSKPPVKAGSKPPVKAGSKPPVKAGSKPSMKVRSELARIAESQLAVKAKSNLSVKAALPDHVLLRLRSENGATLNEHAAVIARHGVAMLGKVGRPLGPDFIEELNRQIAEKVPTYLFLATRGSWNAPYLFDRCRLNYVHTTLPAEKRRLVPTYYVNETQNIQTWFEISSLDRLTREELLQITVRSSGREISSAIRSLTAVFRVVVGKPSKATQGNRS